MTPQTPAARRIAPYLALAVLCSVQMMLFLDDTVVNVALPSIQRTLGMSEADLTWIVNAYLLVFGGFLLLGGRCADLFGGRAAFAAGTAIFAAGSLATALAQDPLMMIISRASQGLGGAFASPGALAMVAGLFSDPRERSRALGIWAGLGGFAATLGVLVSGVLTEYATWRWCFLINIPVAAVALIAVPRLGPSGQAHERPAERDRRVDVYGAALITAAVAALDLGLADSGRASVTATASRVAVGAILLIAFAVTESRHRAPLIPLRFFAQRDRAFANLINVAFCSAILSMLFFLTLYMQEVLRYSPARTGVAWLPFCAAVITGFALSTALVPRLGVRPMLVTALGTGAAGMFLLGTLQARGGYTGMLPGLLVAGLGMGLGFVSITIAAVGQSDPDVTGLASGLVTSTQQLGGAAGLGILGALATHRSAHSLALGLPQAEGLTQGFRLAFQAGGILLIAAAMAAVAGITAAAGIVPAKTEQFEPEQGHA
jgi:EmrB/QacA subfamily drug resistance transporter